MEPSYIGAYWGSRPESASQCGERLARCIAALANIDPALGAWFERGASKASAKTPVELAAPALGELLAKGRNRRDFGGEAIEQLGFSVGLWNRARPVVGLSGTVGAHPTVPGILNSFVLELPALDEESAGLYVPGAAVTLIQAVVEAWDPDWATWTTHGLRNSQESAPREPVIGWLTYLRNVGVEAMPVASESLGDGVLICAGRDFAAVDEAAVGAVRQHLQRASALNSIP